MVSSWTDWSPCSVTCGVGFTQRYREYVKKDLKDKCNTNLKENKTCMVTERCLDESLMSISDIKSLRSHKYQNCECINCVLAF